MKAYIKYIAAVLSVVSIGAQNLQARNNAEYRKALELYRAGMYDRARAIFEAQPDDPLCWDYAVLCAVKTRSQNCGMLVDAVDSLHPRTMLYSAIHHEYANVLFDEGNYSRATQEFSKVKYKSLDRHQRCEYWFKRGFCELNREEFDEAQKCFGEAVKYDSQYLDPSRFALGIIAYNRKDFAGAAEWFELSRNDDRFGDLCEFYLVDCRFMQKDYDYVIDRGEKIYDNVPEERRQHLSRILSESYLVKGNSAMARRFLSYENLQSKSISDLDHFHAASVYYAEGDYKQAVKHFNLMSDRSDSIGQIANYQLAGSYLKIRNNGEAMNAFKSASEASFDDSITEDALFNYAKLSFDLNGDESVFQRYLARYNTSRKGELIYDYLATAALKRRDYAAAVDAYDEIDELNDYQQSNYIKANFMRADQLVKSQSYSMAIRYFKSTAYYLAKTDPLYQLSQYYLAECYYAIDAYKDAIGRYKELHNLSALSNRREGKLIPYNMAYCYYRLGDWSEAAKAFDSYIRTGDPMVREDALLRRADCDFARKDYASAAASYRNLLKEFSSSDKIYPVYRLGVSYGLAGEKYRKVEALSPVLDSDPDAPLYCDALYELGRAYADVADYDHAIQVFDILRTSSKDPEFIVRSVMGTGMAKRNSGDLDGALESYMSVVSNYRESDYTKEALLSIQSIYNAKKEPQKYLEYIEKNKINAVGNESDRRNLYFSTAEQVYQAGNYSAAVVSFSKYLRMYPDGTNSAEAYYYLGASYKALGQKEKACENYRKALDNNLSGSYAIFAMLGYASLSYSLQDYESAYAAYKSLAQSSDQLTDKLDAYVGMMRSAYAAKMYDKTIEAGASVLQRTTDEALRRETMYKQAKSYLFTSRRDQAFDLLTKLSASAATAEGAEAYYLIIQARYDWGKYDAVETGVYDFATKCGNQSYWLARAYIVLGDSFVARNNIEAAVNTYQSILDGYEPSSDGDDIREIVSRKIVEL